MTKTRFDEKKEEKEIQKSGNFFLTTQILMPDGKPIAYYAVIKHVQYNVFNINIFNTSNQLLGKLCTVGIPCNTEIYSIENSSLKTASQKHKNVGTALIEILLYLNHSNPIKVHAAGSGAFYFKMNFRVQGERGPLSPYYDSIQHQVENFDELMEDFSNQHRNLILQQTTTCEINKVLRTHPFFKKIITEVWQNKFFFNKTLDEINQIDVSVLLDQAPFFMSPNKVFELSSQNKRFLGFLNRDCGMMALTDKYLEDRLNKFNIPEIYKSRNTIILKQVNQLKEEEEIKISIETIRPQKNIFSCITFFNSELPLYEENQQAQKAYFKM